MFESIIGQEKAADVLRGMAESGRIPHALLFAGPNGVGKIEAALELAARLLCENGLSADCGTWSACIRAKSGEHPDIHLLFPYRAKPKSGETTTWLNGLIETRERIFGDPYSTVEFERTRFIVAGLANEVREKLQESSFEGGRRVCVVARADKMNATTANSLLKIIEEPPEGVHFIMTAERLSGVLPTITSRSSVLRFRRLANEDIVKYLVSRHNVPEKDAEAAAQFADGSLKNAKRYIIEGRSETVKRAFDIYNKIVSGNDDTIINEASEFQWSRDTVEAEELLRGFVRATRTVMELKTGHGSGIMSGLPLQSAETLASIISLGGIRKLAGAFENAFVMLGRNVNISTVMTTLFYEIQSAYNGE